MKSKQLTYSLIAKITAYFLITIFIVLAVVSAVGGVCMVNNNFYTVSEKQIKDNAFSDMVFVDSSYVLRNYQLEEGSVDNYCENLNYTFEIFERKEDNSGWEMGEAIGGNYSGKDTKYFYENVNEERLVKSYIDDKFPISDKYSFTNKVIGIAYQLKYAVFAIGIISVLLAIICFIFLMCSAGHKDGDEEIVRCGLAKIPFDLLTAGVLLAIFLSFSVAYETLNYNNGITIEIFWISAFVAIIPIITAYCMILAVHLKLRFWWKNTLIYYAVMLLIRCFKKIGRGVSVILGNFPIIWKAALMLVAISGLELFCVQMFSWNARLILELWFIEKLILSAAILYVVVVLRKLQKGGEKLASGDLSYQINTNRMFWDLKEHGENLNSIAGGMNFAVEERMKSERFKTELITNVSHDIKTPLTSIINYADLICKEESGNGKISEYSEVLLRQSERLKRLIEDLVEASKASTGNIDVFLAPCELGVLLTQIVGEYQQNLQRDNLELIVKQPAAPVKIMADGKHISRIFDNLMNNISKYSQKGTRVYLNLESDKGHAIISFKNTSSSALDISADELMERFVRGDESRATEGSGLGLSIAKSLTELQGGKMEMTVDGDLFKVLLKFEAVK